MTSVTDAPPKRSNAAIDLRGQVLRISRRLDSRQPPSTEVLMRLIGLAVVITLNLLLAPLAVDAQPSEKVYRIGMLERTSKTLMRQALMAFSGACRSSVTWRGSTSSSSTESRSDRGPVQQE
jgi:hypothetical protein